MGIRVALLCVTKMLVEVWYPAMLQPRAMTAEDMPAFVWLEAVLRPYMFLPAAIPLLSLCIIVSIPNQAFKPSQIAYISLTGVLLGAIAIALGHKLQRQLARIAIND